MEDKKIENTTTVEETLKVTETVIEKTDDEESLNIESKEESNEDINDELEDDLDLDSEDLLNDDFGDEFKTDIEDSKTNIDKDSFSEDFSSYAKGFPDWDLLPPKD